MNAAARVLAQGSLFRGGVNTVNWSKQTISVMVLFASVLSSALGVIYVENSERHVFSELQSLQQTSDQLQIERSQLLLERSTWGAPTRVQNIAENRLEMSNPKSDQIKIVR